MDVTVVVPTHNPHPGRLHRTLAGLRAQTLPGEKWETLVIDNASDKPVAALLSGEEIPPRTRVIGEPVLGLTAARTRGFHEARGRFVVLVDDDNVLAPDYLAQVVRLFGEHPRLGAFGGRSRPEFERPPAAWQNEFFGLLALRDHGDVTHFSGPLRPPGATLNAYPEKAAPIGAGMALRREAALHWAKSAAKSPLTDRRGGELTSGGDNDIVLTVLGAGWEVAYFPQLALTHLIPAGRLDPGYLARLNRGIQKSWMQVLSRHEANPWPPIPGWSVTLRQARAWWTHRAWSGPAARIRWQGACGHFEGRALVNSSFPPST